MNTRNITIAILLVLAVALAACGPRETAVPTQPIEAIYTAAAQTVEAQFTQQAALQPTATPTLPPTPTETPIPTETPGAATATPTQRSGVVVPTQPVCYRAAFVSDVTIPDGTVMAPGFEFTKTWRLRNTGTCAWQTNFRLVLVSGEAMNAQLVPLLNPIAPGNTVDVSLKMRAPNRAGDFISTWRMADDKGAGFAEQFWVKVKVSGNTATPTVTGTITVTATVTGTPGIPVVLTSTPTPTATSTATPTVTPTVTPTATYTVAAP